MTRVLVEIPNFAVVAVRQSIANHPLVLVAVSTSLGNQPRDQSGRADIILQPLIGCMATNQPKQKMLYSPEHIICCYRQPAVYETIDCVFCTSRTTRQENNIDEVPTEIKPHVLHLNACSGQRVDQTEGVFSVYVF